MLKRSWAGEARNVSVLVAIGVGADGCRRILGVAEGHKEDKSGWGRCCVRCGCVTSAHGSNGSLCRNPQSIKAPGVRTFTFLIAANGWTGNRCPSLLAKLSVCLHSPQRLPSITEDHALQETEAKNLLECGKTEGGQGSKCDDFNQVLECQRLGPEDEIPGRRVYRH